MASNIECSELECGGEVLLTMLVGCWGVSQLPDNKLTRFGFTVCCELGLVLLI